MRRVEGVAAWTSSSCRDVQRAAGIDGRRSRALCYDDLKMAVRMVGRSRRCVTVRPDLQINGFKVFSATMHQQREQLGETVTAWIASHAHLSIVDITAVQSSDAMFHCITIVVAYREPRARR